MRGAGQSVSVTHSGLPPPSPPIPPPVVVVVVAVVSEVLVDDPPPAELVDVVLDELSPGSLWQPAAASVAAATHRRKDPKPWIAFLDKLIRLVTSKTP